MLAVPRFCRGTSLLVLCIVACDRNQPVAPSAVEAASTAAGGPRLNAPSNTNAVAVSDSRIDVSWQDNSTNETGFEVHRSRSGPSGMFTLRASTGANVRTDSDTGLDPSTQYCYKVRAIRRADGRTSYSEFSTTACAPAGGVQVTAVTTGVDLDPDGYTVMLDVVTQAGTVPVTSTNVAANGTVTISGLRAGDYYRVTLGDVAPNCGLNSPNLQAVAVVGGSTAAVGFDVTCALSTPPAAPSWLDAYGFFGLITLMWTDHSNNEDGFKVERCQEVTCGDADFTLIAITGANVARYDDGDVLDGTFYTYRVRATNKAGDSAPVLAAGKTCVYPVDLEGPC